VCGLLYQLQPKLQQTRTGSQGPPPSSHQSLHALPMAAPALLGAAVRAEETYRSCQDPLLHCPLCWQQPGLAGVVGRHLQATAAAALAAWPWHPLARHCR
jgi:hypothetical protein